MKNWTKYYFELISSAIESNVIKMFKSKEDPWLHTTYNATNVERYIVAAIMIIDMRRFRLNISNYYKFYS